MKRVTLLILLVFMAAPIVVSQSDSSQEQSATQSAQDETQTYFDALPKNPILRTNTTTYKTADLQEASGELTEGQALDITQLVVNNQGLPVFQLKDGRYLLASRATVLDDVPYDTETIDETYWLKPNATPYDSPYTRLSQKKSTSLQAYSQVKVVAQAKTQAGLYYQLSDQNWVSSSDVSTLDNRMEKVQTMLEQKYNKSNYSIYVKQVDTQAVAGINQDTTMYSASVSKLPILYAVQEALDNQTISLSTKYRYTDKVNHFTGAYDPAGAGEMSKTPDNKDYTVQDLITAVTKHSDNVASNMLAYYVTNQFDANYQKLLQNLGITWDMTSRNVSAKTAGLIMEALYEQNGDVLKSLTQTDFDDKRIAKNIPVKVAHKIGDAYDYKHDVAVVYADSPFILSIFTNDATYEDITAIADDVYAILK